MVQVEERQWGLLGSPQRFGDGRGQEQSRKKIRRECATPPLSRCQLGEDKGERHLLQGEGPNKKHPPPQGGEEVGCSRICKAIEGPAVCIFQGTWLYSAGQQIGHRKGKRGKMVHNGGI